MFHSLPLEVCLKIRATLSCIVAKQNHHLFLMWCFQVFIGDHKSLKIFKEERQCFHLFYMNKIKTQQNKKRLVVVIAVFSIFWFIIMYDLIKCQRILRHWSLPLTSQLIFLLMLRVTVLKRKKKKWKCCSKLLSWTVNWSSKRLVVLIGPVGLAPRGPHPASNMHMWFLTGVVQVYWRAKLSLLNCYWKLWPS